MSFLARPLANRGVHLRITPRPSSLGETREMLRLLSRFGEIEYFKNLKYDGQGLGTPNVALVIFKEEEGAKNLFRGSPVRFRMGRVRAGGRTQEGGGAGQADEQATTPLSAQNTGSALSTPTSAREPSPQQQQPPTRRHLSTTSLPTPTPKPIRMPFDPPSPPDITANQAEEVDRIFQIHTSPTRRNFRDQINMGHYHGKWLLDSKTPGQQDLAKRVPVVGLSCVDWRKRERPWRVVRREAEGGRGVRLGSLWEKSMGETGQ